MPAKPLPQSATEFLETFPKTPALIRHPVRCGRSSCRCARGEQHESWRLVWRGSDGRQRHLYVRKTDLLAVRRIVERRQTEERRAREATSAALAELRQIARLCRELGPSREG